MKTFGQKFEQFKSQFESTSHSPFGVSSRIAIPWKNGTVLISLLVFE